MLSSYHEEFQHICTISYRYTEEMNNFFLKNCGRCTYVMVSAPAIIHSASGMMSRYTFEEETDAVSFKLTFGHL